MINNKKQDPDMPIEPLKQVKDDLPSPSELAKSMEAVRITIMLSKSSVDYFKKSARKHHSKYQRMMRQVLDNYVSKHVYEPAEKV